VPRTSQADAVAVSRLSTPRNLNIWYPALECGVTGLILASGIRAGFHAEFAVLGLTRFHDFRYDTEYLREMLYDCAVRFSMGRLGKRYEYIAMTKLYEEVPASLCTM
jgi:hypothetical protein